MSTYLNGCDVLGADAVTAVTATESPPWVTASRKASADKVKHDADVKKRVAAVNTIVAINVGAFLVSTIGGAFLWKTHRVLGGVIGALLVAPVIGGTGTVLYIANNKDVRSMT
jgi:hypothetical protein